jgi:hypothetical protein
VIVRSRVSTSSRVGVSRRASVMWRDGRGESAECRGFQITQIASFAVDSPTPPFICIE